MISIDDNKLWLVHIKYYEVQWDNVIIPPYKYFGNDHYLFRDNGIAVDFIRKKAEENNLQEIWIDIDWDKNDKEYCTYLAFEDEYTNELSVYFDLTEIK